ncbi:securin [Myripristis murdjan]|uniref:Securin n=1 Tax=Myripristis murdjan TaxID=586833 RepID=A0A667ZJH1_9TELE|nr:securin-like [Myripristis murdjan]XP_029917711.1 securin-like [Myripristis murdjan]
MANIIFAERENAGLHAATLKMRPRLQSAPDNILKTSLTGKKCHTPLPSGRKALVAVNKIASTPAVHEQKKHQKTQEAKEKCVPQTKVEEYPDIEKFIPYDPLEFEKYSISEDLVHLGGLSLPGLARFPQTTLYEDNLETFEAFTPPSPLKMPQRRDTCKAELDAFLQTLDELTIDLPPESDCL